MGENPEIVELTCLGKSRRHCSHQILGMIICHHHKIRDWGSTWINIQLPHPRGMQGRKFIGHISQIRESISEHQHSSVFRLHTHYGIGWPISHFSISRIVCYWASTRYLHAWNNHHSLAVCFPGPQQSLLYTLSTSHTRQYHDWILVSAFSTSHLASENSISEAIVRTLWGEIKDH